MKFNFKNSTHSKVIRGRNLGEKKAKFSVRTVFSGYVTHLNEFLIRKLSSRYVCKLIFHKGLFKSFAPCTLHATAILSKSALMFVV